MSAVAFGSPEKRNHSTDHRPRVDHNSAESAEDRSEADFARIGAAIGEFFAKKSTRPEIGQSAVASGVVPKLRAGADAGPDGGGFGRIAAVDQRQRPADRPNGDSTADAGPYGSTAGSVEWGGDGKIIGDGDGLAAVAVVAGGVVGASGRLLQNIADVRIGEADVQGVGHSVDGPSVSAGKTGMQRGRRDFLAAQCGISFRLDD